MDVLYYYFVKSAVDDSPRETPLCFDVFVGGIGDPLVIDGVGYIITDWCFETLDSEPEGDSLYW